MNDYSSLDELFDIYDGPATESLEMMAATTVARVGGAGIAHMVHTIDADKAGQLTNDELRELKEAAKWCRSKFKSMAPDIVKDRLNKGIVKLGKNDKILKSNIANFDFNASISDDKMRDEHWAPVVTATSDITNVSGGLTNYGYDFYKLIKGELEKKYPNCEMDSMEVGKYIYVLKYKKSKAVTEGSATESITRTYAKISHKAGLALDRHAAKKIDEKEVQKNKSSMIEAAKELGEITDSAELSLFKSVALKAFDVARKALAKEKKKRDKVTINEKQREALDKALSMVVEIPSSVDMTYARKYRVIPFIKSSNAGAVTLHEGHKYTKIVMDAVRDYIFKSDIQDKYQIDLMEMGFDGYVYGLQFVGKREGNHAKESAIGGDEKMNDLFEGLFEMSEDAYADSAFESIATNLKRDYQEDPEEPISLKSMYCVHMNDDALKKYQEEYDQLKKVDKNAEKLRGCMYFWQKELAAFISIDIRSDKVWIDTLEVVKKFRGKKLSFQLLDVAVRKFHATDLKVHIDNKKAIGIFKTYGFKTYDKKNNWLYMTLRDDVKDIDDKHTEDVKPVDKGTKTDDIQEAKESVSEATESSLFNKSKNSTGVEKLLAHTEPTLRRQLTTVEDCDKYLEVIKNESIKFNEAANAIISAYSKYESGDKTKEDTKEFNKTVAAGKKLLNDNCRKLNVRLGKLVGDNDHISRQDVKNFAQYISGLRKIVNSIKRELKNR